jgi:hypothetical protein
VASALQHVGTRACAGLLLAGCGGSAVAPPAAALDASDAAREAQAAEATVTEAGDAVRLDETFGIAGEITGELSVWTAAGVAIDPQGRILIAGPDSNTALPPSETIRRFSPDGALDTTFGAGGHVTLTVSANQWRQVLRAWPTGNVGVLGAADVAGGSRSFVAVLTATALDASLPAAPTLSTFAAPFDDGLWDDSGGGFLIGATATTRFGAGGSVDDAFGAGGAVAGAHAGALGADGKLWTATGTEVRRYLANGSADTTFGQTGAIDMAAAAPDAAPSAAPDIAIESLVVSASGALVIASHTDNLVSYVDVAHISEAGVVDHPFGATPPVPTLEAPVGAGSLASGRTWVWTAGGTLLAFAADDSLEGTWNLLDAPGTLLDGVLDSMGRLIVIGIDSSDPQNAGWFVRRYGLF